MAESYFAQAPALTVQLHAAGGELCWGADLVAGDARNTSSRYKGSCGSGDAPACAP